MTGAIVKVVGGADAGGIRTAEIQFTRAFRDAGQTVHMLIVGEGAAVGAYRDVADSAFFVPQRVRPFGGGAVRRAWSIIEAVRIAGGIAEAFVAGSGATRASAVIVRRPFLVPVAGRLARAYGAGAYWHMPEDIRTVAGRLALRALVRRDDVRVVGNSPYTLASLGVDGEVVFPGFDPERIAGARRGELRARMGISSAVPVYGSLARLHPDKAQDLLVAAFVESGAFRAGAHLVLAGPSSQPGFADEVRHLAAARGEGRIHVLGQVEDVATFYADVDIFVNGRRNAEPFGIAVVEALAAGVPVIAYREGGPSLTIVDGETGWLCDAPTVDAFLDAFDRSHRDNHRWREMGEAAKSASAQFEVRNQASRFLEIIGANR